MNQRTFPEPLTASIAAVERDTGIGKDTLRIWERRYGFPQPGRDAYGERSYSLDQVEKLRAIKRLLDQGHRPGRIVALPIEALQRLSQGQSSTPQKMAISTTAPELRDFMACILGHDAEGLRRKLHQAVAAMGHFRFVTELVAPLNGMVTEFLRYLPSIVGAALIFFIGFVLATVVRRMVEATVEAVELDRRLIDAGLTHTPKGPGLARLLGLLAFTLIIIPVAIAALQALNITAISDPATAMLNGILLTIPRVIGAALIIFIAYLIGRWVMTLIEEGLKSIGFDDIIAGIANARFNVAGLMPHPDRAVEGILGTEDGRSILSSMISALESKKAAA